jgi:hypothetical protein
MAMTKFTLMPAFGEKEENFETSSFPPDLVKAFKAGEVTHGFLENNRKAVWINLKSYRYLVVPEGA